jgi:hypothetical protein
VIKIGRLKWLGHLFRMQEMDPCRKLTLLKPESTTRHVGNPELRWLESVGEDLAVEQWRTNFGRCSTKNCNSRREEEKRRRRKKERRKKKKKSMH